MEELRQRAPVTAIRDPSTIGIFQPFRRPALTPISFFTKELKPVFSDAKGRRLLWLGSLNVTCSVLLIVWSKTSNSMALSAFSYLILFDLLCILNCMLSIWVAQQKPNASFSFGYERFDVLAIFASTILAGLSSFFILKESVERGVQQPEIHTGRMLPGIIVAFATHFIVTYGINHWSLLHVISASSSSWLQEHVAEVSQSICHIIPGLSTVLLPRVNPLVLLGWGCSVTLLLAHFFIEMYAYHTADTVAAAIVALMVFGTMFPMSMYCAKQLLQTTPSYLLGQLDKCLREASTLDGVLEFRHEYFWTLSFGKLAGSVHVRVRRDANEQLVLAHIVDRLSSLVTDLTVQVFKDEWAWSSSFQYISENNKVQGTAASPVTSSESMKTKQQNVYSLSQSNKYPSQPIYLSNLKN